MAESPSQSDESTERQPTWWSRIRQIGPGIAIAATGVGAADLVTSTVAGSRFGTVLAWAIVVGALLKYVLNEGVARWHLATGTSVLQGWGRYLGRPALAMFFLYLLIWCFVVSGGLIVASGLAAHSVLPVLSRQAWGVLQSLIALGLVWVGSYQGFERLMKAMIAIMFTAIVGCAVAVASSAESVLAAPALPAGSLALSLALAGGVGGSVTMLVYGYWIQEKRWAPGDSLNIARLDLGVAYGVTAVLALGAMLLASEVLLPQKANVEGQQGLIQMASMLSGILGPSGQWIFLIGFWGAAFSSMLGVFQGVPYLFADLSYCWKSDEQAKTATSPTFDFNVAARSLPYRVSLVLLATLPMLLLFYDKPIWVVVMYAAVSSWFLPILTIALLIMNNQSQWVGEAHCNRWRTNVALSLSLILFAYLAIQAVWNQLA